MPESIFLLQEALLADCIFLSLQLFGNLLHLKKVSTKDGQLSLRGDIRKCALADAVITFTVALFLVGFSDSIADFCVSKSAIFPHTSSLVSLHSI